MIVPIASWSATTAPRWRTSFSMSHGAAARGGSREHAGYQHGHLVAPDCRDGPALLVPPDVVLAAAPGIDLLAGVADHHLGVHPNLYRADFRVLRPRRRHADRSRDPVGHPVPWPARVFSVVP